MSNLAESSTLRDEFGNEVVISTSITGERTNATSIEEIRRIIKTDWPDIEDSSEDDSDAGEEKEEDEDDKISDIKLPAGIHDIEVNKKCKCKSPQNEESCIYLMAKMVNWDVKSENVYCICDNIIRCYNLIFKSNQVYSEYKLAFADLFFRLRHETLFKLLCKSLNLPAHKSDISFSKFGIDSNRTPDLILEEKGVIYVIEVTATSSIERAAITKGMEEMGFESKYQKEIDMLINEGIPVSYCPVFFNMSDISNPLNLDQYNKLSDIFRENEFFKILLKNFAKNFSVITNDLKYAIAFSATMLFTDTDVITSNHPQHKFLYNTNKTGSNKRRYYKGITVSNVVYNKVLTNWDRLEYILDKCNVAEFEKLSLVIETNKHRMNFEFNKYGRYRSEIMDVINRNDKLEFFKNVYLKTGNKVFSCLGSETGVTFIESSDNYENVYESKELNLISNHKASVMKNKPYDIDFYRQKCLNFQNQEMQCNIYDPDYEDKLIESILNMDNKYNLGGSDTNLKIKLAGEKLLGQIKSDSINMENVIAKLIPDYVIKNSENDGIPKTRLKMKNPFLMPLANINSSDYCSLDFKNKEFMLEVIELIQDQPYTKQAILLAVEDNYNMYTPPHINSDILNKLIAERSKFSQQSHLLFKKAKKVYPNLKKLNDCNIPEIMFEHKNIKEKLNNLNKEIRNRQNVEGTGKNISYIRLPSKGKKSYNKINFNKEMEHFNKKEVQSTIEGVGLINDIKSDYEKDKSIFDEICSDLITYAGKNPNKLLDSYTSEDSNLLFDLKKKGLELYEDLLESIQNSCLGHASAFISRLGFSLMFFSQQPFSSDYVRIDNLGYKDVLLIVRGGEKVFKTHKSKFFRLVYPILNSTVPWYLNGHSNKSSYRLVNIGEKHYIITPWIFWHENILSDSISFYHRVCSFTLLNSNPRKELSMQFHRLQLNIMLAFHNRRQTEVLLANLRYILLSTLGDYTGVEGILSDFFGFNYDCFQSFIRNSIIINYPNYFQKIKDMKYTGKKSEISESELTNNTVMNIFTNNPIENSEDLTLMIYSTFLMTKAPYQKLVERANNLKSILSIHELYDRTVGLKLNPQDQFDKLNVCLEDCDNDYTKYSQKLFDNDFSFDAKYCALIGGFMDSYFINENLSDQLNSEWFKILNQNWDELATSTGLRGRYDDIENFWGKKGYFVVYKTLLTNDEFRSTTYTLLTSNHSDNEKRKILRGMNKIYKDSINIESEFLIFHAVDKSQWRGSREIYVMNIDTKLMQQPIEKFMGFLCTKIDNELISVPSDKRSQVIHHAIFEKDLPLKDVLTWYLTLDCSKWAPKSVFVKFSICINNMTCLPNSFKIHFLNYIEKLFQKRLYFNINEVEVLINNPMYKDICNRYLIKDDNVNGYYIQAPYSWVMGIFNYTSSFLHAANQKYFSYILQKTTMLSYSEEISMVMYAHSDDSGGRICAVNEYQLQRALILYEINLHAANHLLSRKKSVISRIYFEILSIIYMFKKLLALLPKFLGGLRFLPSDKGVSQDLLQCYSKCVEVMVNGADFSIAYIVLKIMSHMIFKFYFNRDPVLGDYQRPVQYCGMPDAHPIMILLCGSDADLLRLTRTNKDKDNLQYLLAYVNYLTPNDLGEGPFKPLKFVINVKNLNKDFSVYKEFFENITDKWSYKNVNYHSTPLNTISFLKKLSDPGFVGSLTNESTVRRISRAYYISYGNSVITTLGNKKLKSFIDSLNLMLEFSSNNNVVRKIFDTVYNDLDYQKIIENIISYRMNAGVQMDIFYKTMASPLKLLKYFDKLSMQDRNINVVERTLKPTLVQLVKGNTIFSCDFEPASLVSYLKEPELRWALNNVKNLNTASIELNRYLEKINKNIDTMPEDLLLRLCRSFGRDNIKSIYMYSRVPGSIRSIKTYSAFLSFLAANSFKNKEIEGLTVKLLTRDLAKDYLMTHISEEIYLINNIICLISLLCKKCSNDFVRALTIPEIIELDFKGGDIIELIQYLKECLEQHPEGVMCKLQIRIIEHLLNTENLGFEGSIYETAFYTFTKEQKSRSGWYGVGEIYININKAFYIFKIKNNEVTDLVTNQIGKLNSIHERFIMDVFENTNLTIPKTKIVNYKVNELGFGYDLSGSLTISNCRDLERGIKTNLKPEISGLIAELDYFTIKNVIKDFIILKQDNIDSVKQVKLYHLPLKKAELVNVLNNLIIKTEFQPLLDTQGLGSFEEYIATELMPDFGAELYVTFEQFIDNYSNSRLYEIMQTCRNTNISKLPNKMEFSLIPASESSLVRILIDYSNNTNDYILKSPNYIDSDIMKLRSEYPDQVATLLVENMVKNYDNIYDSSEQNEITESYQKVLMGDNSNEIRNALIKLMTHWGYASLVNVIEEYKLLKRPQNYIFYNYEMCYIKYKQNFSDCFEFLINILIKNISIYKDSIDTNTLHVNEFSNLYSIDGLLREYIFNLCVGLYNVQRPMISYSLTEICFNDIISNLLQDDDFVKSLNKDLSENLYLASIPINYKNRFNFIILINTLKYTWLMTNKQQFKINFTEKLQRIPNNITPLVGFFRKFNLKMPPIYTYRFGFIDDNLYSYLLRSKEIENNDFTIKYRIDNKVKQLGSEEVNICESLVFKRPLQTDVFDTPEWEELQAELEMIEEDEDTIKEIWDSIENKYVKKSTRKLLGGKIVRATIVWVVILGAQHKVNLAKYVRQMGENVVILTDTVMNGMLKLYNSGVRLVNFSKVTGTSQRPLLAYYTFQKELNNREFINKLLSQYIPDLSKSKLDILKLIEIRDSDGLNKNTLNLGRVFTGKERMVKGEFYKLKNDVIIPADEYEEEEAQQITDERKIKSVDELPVEEITKEELEKRESIRIVNELKNINDEIKKLTEKYGFREETKNKLVSKYHERILSGVPLNIVFKSLMGETELMQIKQSIEENTLKLKTEQVVQIMQNPSHFGLAYSTSKTDKDPIRDRKLKSEIESLSPGLSSLIASSTLVLSESYKKILMSHYKMWFNMTKHSDMKTENKRFLLVLFLSLVKNAKVIEEDKNQDNRWRDIIDKFTVYFAQTLPDSDDESMLDEVFTAIPGARITYKLMGT